MIRWIFSHVLWDAAGVQSSGAQRAFWAMRKVWIALALSGLLDWMEWVMHHPPTMGFVAVFHFAFALAIVSIVVFLWQRLRSA